MLYDVVHQVVVNFLSTGSEFFWHINYDNSYFKVANLCLFTANDAQYLLVFFYDELSHFDFYLLLLFK